jgi:hypothetical protein
MDSGIMMGQGSKEWKMRSAHETEAATQGILFITLMRTMNGRARLGLRSSTLRATIRSPTARAFNNELIVQGAAAKVGGRPR